MALDLMKLFKSIKWAKNGDVTDMNQTNYEVGWSHLGDDTPTVEDFNLIQQLNDRKDQWLFAQIEGVLKDKKINATEEDVTALVRAIKAIAGAYSKPQNISATSENTSTEQGHTHTIDKATTSKSGITQLDSSTNSTAEDKAATPKAVKIVKDLIDALTRNLGNYIPKSKKSSEVNSNSADTVATSAAVKTAYDTAVDAKNSAVLLTGDQKDIKGYKSFNATLESKYRIIVRRNENNFSPYMWLLDQSVDMSGDTAKNKNIGEFLWRAGGGDGIAKAIVKTFVLEDKNAFIEIGGWNSGNQYKVLFKGFTKTSNVTIGTGTDNNRDRLQVNGTISATTPAQDGSNEQVVTIGWAKESAKGYVKKSGDTMTGQLTVPKINLTENADGQSLKIGDDAWLGDGNVSNGVWLKGQSDANQGYIAFGNAKKKLGFDGVNFSADSGVGARWFGSLSRGEGAYVNQWNTEAPYHVNAGNANGRNVYFPYIKGKVANGDGWGTAFSFGYTTPGARNQFGIGVIHLIEDNGTERKWTFAHGGRFTSAEDVVTGSGKSLNNTHQLSYDYVHVTGSQNHGGLNIAKPDGKNMRVERQGNAFKFWCQDRYEILMPERSGEVALRHEVVLDVRLGAVTSRKLEKNWDSHGNGYVVTGFNNVSDDLNWNDHVYLRPIQKFINNQWITVANA